MVGKIDNWHLCVGGSHRLAHALWRDLAQHGGIMVSDAEVDSIVVDGGRAVGVTLASGEQITARKAVCSTVSVEQTLVQFVDPQHVSAELRERVATKVKHKDWTLFSVHAALDATPQYSAAAFDPDVDRAWVVNLGYASTGDLDDDWRQIRAGGLPDPRPNAAVNSLYDPTDAPEGYYTGLLRQFAPFSIGADGPAAWDTLGRWYGQRCLDAWASHAPNMADAVVDWATFSPLDISRKMVNMIGGDWMMGEISLDNMLDERPLPELGQYRTPIEGLYMAGSTQHPHGYITFGPAYNALQVIADDLGIDPWWRDI